jgi:hypothetical protein
MASENSVAIAAFTERVRGVTHVTIEEENLADREDRENSVNQRKGA